MNSHILLRQVQLNGNIVDVLVEGNRFKLIRENIENPPADCFTVDCTDMAICPPYYNGHAHTPMTLLRGCSDDIELHEWLEKHIWPMEAKLNENDIYVGTKLGALEMIKSGTVFVNDMYWHSFESAKAFDEMGMRACVAICMIDHSMITFEDNLKQFFEAKKAGHISERIILSLGPHSVYTVSKENLLKALKVAKENDLFLHIHCGETQTEFSNCVKQTGMSPVAYLNSLSFLTPKTILAHCVYLTKEDIEIIKKTGAIVTTQPISNCKLASGAIDFDALSRSHIPMLVGTDGCSSNNSLDIVTEMRIAGLSAKLKAMDPRVCSAKEIYQIGTLNGARTFGIDGGSIEEGKLADCLLINLNNTRMIADYDIISNLVNSADQTCIDSLMCDGKFLMLNRKVEGEELIIKEARMVSKRLHEEKKKMDEERQAKS